MAIHKVERGLPLSVDCNENWTLHGNWMNFDMICKNCGTKLEGHHAVHPHGKLDGTCKAFYPRSEDEPRHFKLNEQMVL